MAHRDMTHVLADRSAFRRTPEPWFLSPIQLLVNAHLTNTPLACVAYWGIGLKHQADGADRRAIAFMELQVARLAGAVGVKHSITLIITDTHAAINGIPAAQSDEYVDSITAISADIGARVERMSAVCNTARDATSFELCDELEEIDYAFDRLPESVRKELIASARRRSSGDAERSARRYVMLSAIEAPTVRARFLDNMLLTYQPPHLAWLLPALPTLYMFVDERRTTRRPWFSIEGEA